MAQSGVGLLYPLERVLERAFFLFSLSIYNLQHRPFGAQSAKTPALAVLGLLFCFLDTPFSCLLIIHCLPLNFFGPCDRLPRQETRITAATQKNITRRQSPDFAHDRANHFLSATAYEKP
jgi:hypothetical protein